MYLLCLLQRQQCKAAKDQIFAYWKKLSCKNHPNNICYQAGGSCWSLNNPTRLTVWSARLVNPGKVNSWFAGP